MGNITVTGCNIEGLFIIEPEVHTDSRGYFIETYNKQDFMDAGLTMEFVQDNQAKSSRGVLRGMHYQVNHPQGKLMRVLQGRVFDVAVDMRKGSATYGKWFGVELTEENQKQFYIPEYFAHGYLVLSDTAVIAYKCTDFYHPGDEGGIPYNDPKVGIQWPIEEGMELMLSERDKNWSLLQFC